MDKRIVTVLIAAGVLALGSAAMAKELATLEASAVSQGTIADSDFFLLTEFFGFTLAETLDYQSTADASGWTGTLSGTYLGTSVDVSYSGDLSAYPGGAITCTSSGSFGPHAWNGNGTFSITDTGGAGFQVDFQSSLDVGANSGGFDLLIEGTADPSEIRFVDSSGTGIPRSMKPSFKWDIASRTIITDVELEGIGEIIINEWVVGAGNATIAGPITTVPAPATLPLLALGGLALVRRRRPH